MIYKTCGMLKKQIGHTRVSSEKYHYIYYHDYSLQMPKYHSVLVSTV